MHPEAHTAVQQAWSALVKVRALCPAPGPNAVGMTQYESPGWYRARGAVYFVRPEHALTELDVEEVSRMASFVNRSFIITLAALLESHGVTEPDRSLDGGDHVQLVRWLRNRFAHGDYDVDPSNPYHVETRQLLEAILPAAAATSTGFPASVDKVLEPLKDGVLRYLSQP